MGNIVVLDELTINKIAAGEVIERPASVIKEMCENSVDAGAKNIVVEIKNGGISYIRVSDDGKGIEREDLELSFERHATSKIRKAEDLSEVKSMGFRGEALASIAAISKTTMITKTANAETGSKLTIEGGDIRKIEEIGAPIGTTITVEELFYNTPVRYKFLKKDYTETGYIEDVITRLALVHPEISFKLINSGKPIIQTTGDGNIKNVIYSIYGKSVAGACLNVNYQFEGITITGVVGKPEIARSNRGNQIFFINKRYIKDRILSNATEKAFKGMIPIGKFGFLVLNLEMSPNLVDVNVHPAKLEVRFQEEQKVFKAVYCSIQDTLLKAELIANSETQITGKLERNSDIPVSEKIIEEEQPKSSLSGLFRKIAKGSNLDKDFGSNNVIESIYRSKNGEAELEVQTLRPNVSEHIVPLDAAIEEHFGSKKTGGQEYTNNQTIPNSETDKQDEIKKTINEFMQMGNSLTAEQIREKIAQIAAGSEKKKEENTIEIGENREDEEHLDILNMPNIPMLDTTPEVPALEKAPETPLFTLTKPAELLAEEATKEENNILQDIYQTRNNTVLEEKENYETKKIDTEEIEKFSKKDEEQNINDTIDIVKDDDQKPGDIILNIIQENSRKGLTPEKVAPEQFDDMYAQIFGSEVKNNKEEQKKQDINANDIVSSNMNIFEESEEYKIPYKLLGIAFKTYIILEIENELYIVDQHAAHERIMYEKVKKNYYSDEDKDSQLMLLPDIITLTHKEMDIAMENMDKFEKAGFVLEEFGENTIKLTGVPNICLDLDTKELFLETLDEINTVARTAKQEIEERFIATIACKAAVKANMALTTEEVESLLEKLLDLPNPFTCPHGRPTAIKLSKTDIEKKFARRN